MEIGNKKLFCIQNVKAIRNPLGCSKDVCRWRACHTVLPFGLTAVVLFEIGAAVGAYSPGARFIDGG